MRDTFSSDSIRAAIAERAAWTAKRTTRGSVRDQILDAATTLFYEQGIRAAGVEAIVQRAGVTKVTFYRHFSAKDDLVVAYLDRRAAWERESVELALQMTGNDPAAAFRVIAEAIGVESCAPGFRGCPFINAAAEFPDPDSPVRQAVDRHRRWFLTLGESLLVDLGVREPAEVATELMMLRDGAMVSGYLGDPSRVATALYRAGRAVVQAYR
ncbi:helix-turn-helix domain-containing protein [Micromonospora sp. NPDC047644]|uniref:TetR/AcrR family transcriptional regulator n=1 Tax=Micromonospora sp. NPDC047644 TaxID=3157203 RepID=UPI003451454E